MNRAAALFMFVLLLVVASDTRAASTEDICKHVRGTLVTGADDKTLKLLHNLIKDAKLKYDPVVCRLAYRDQVPPFLGNIISDSKDLVLVISEDFERGMSQLALNAVIAHEVAHWLVENPYAGLGTRPTPEQYLDQESEVDREAARLVGDAAMIIGLQEAERVISSALKDAINNVRENMRRRIEQLRSR